MALSPKQVAAIHIAKNNAGTSDSEYRELLYDIAGVETSKDTRLDNKDFYRIMSRFNSKKPGWKAGQIKKFHQYAKFCGMSTEKSRAELYRITGKMHEEYPDLQNEDFESVMSEMEEQLEKLISSGKRPQPENIKIDYWRKRTVYGKATSRQQYEINIIWTKLKSYFDEEKSGCKYLYGIIGRALKSNVTDLCQLSNGQAAIAIDALKLKLKQEKKKLEKEVPF